jgi:hypothetical protein
MDNTLRQILQTIIDLTRENEEYRRVNKLMGEKLAQIQKEQEAAKPVSLPVEEK